jgi:Icc protein
LVDASIASEKKHRDKIFMKIIQITDLHIGKEGESSFGVDIRRNFLDILKAVKTLKPDFLAITGDICFDVADKKVYAWVKSHLDFLNIPYAVIGGNHDESVMMAKAFKS